MQHFVLTATHYFSIVIFIQLFFKSVLICNPEISDCGYG